MIHLLINVLIKVARQRFKTRPIESYVAEYLIWKESDLLQILMPVEKITLRLLARGKKIVFKWDWLIKYFESKVFGPENLIKWKTDRNYSFEIFRKSHLLTHIWKMTKIKFGEGVDCQMTFCRKCHLITSLKIPITVITTFS
jgi:hypothetical protein